MGLLSLLLLSPLMFVPQANADTLLVSAGLTASPGTICIGQSTHLNWTSTNATSIVISPGVGSVNPYGGLDVYPTQTTTYTITASNTTGGYGSSNTGSVTVYVTGSCGTPTPTPYNNALYCSATYSYANSGDLVSFNAWGGNGTFSWNATDGTPSYGYGSSFSSRFYNPSWYSVSRMVTVTSGYQTANCNVTIYAGGTTWTPTPTPWVNPAVDLALTQVGRNVTRGQSGEYASLTARGGDTLDLIVRTRSVNNSYLYNTFVTEQLPTGFNYIPGSTTVNGYVVADGITSTGINVGTVAPYAQTTIKFSVRVDGAYVPTWGTTTVNSIAQARADNVVTRSVSLPITLGSNASIANISSVKTGPTDSLWLALMVAFLATGAYAVYLRTDRFGRRMALAEVATLARTSGPNFVK